MFNQKSLKNVHHIHVMTSSRSSPLPEQSNGSKSSACANLPCLIFAGSMFIEQQNAPPRSNMDIKQVC